MSDRANGWLLILGGLAIGLVLWLSPSQSKLQCSPSSMARRDFNRLIFAITERVQASCEAFAHGASYLL